MKIAVLAWGSLYWDKRELEIVDDWKEGGAIIPIEFARISNDGRLTLVISEEYGTDVETYWAISKFSNIEDVIENLRIREGTNYKNIGFISFVLNSNHSNYSDKLIQNISLWAKNNMLDGAVWTDLQSNFSKKINKEFNYENALIYLSSLKGETKEKAIEYIKKAPKLIMTKLRKRINTSA